MGRKKIRIARITDDRNRSVTYLKRKAGLMKKAHELAVLTGSEVAVIVFGQNGKLSEFCSGDMDHLLLRYTDHKGPVERKGPEHYSNDNDDDDDDDIGGDYDDGEDDYDGSSGAAGGNPSNSRGGTDFNLNGGPSGGDGNGEMTGNGRSQKRKAPRGKTMSDAHSMSSDSSRRSSSPSTNASGIVSAAATMGGPMIKIEDENNLDRKNLKAAIIQKSLSKPRTESEILLQMNNSTPRPIGMQHHHSFSTGDFNFVHQSQNQQFGEQSRMEMGGLPGQMTPQRPSTAGSSGQVYYNSFATPQRQSPPRFAFNASSETTNINFGNPVPAQQSSFLSPGPVAFTTTTPTPPRNMVSPMNGAFLPANNQSTTYGDLARGGSGDNINQTMLAVPGQNNLTANHLQPGSPGVTNGSNASGLLPLAHPILRQHPQFESYSQQLRTQQQRNASVPLIHTAPPSPHFQVNANGGEQQIGSMQIPVNIAPGSTPNSPLPVPAFAKRSASFGMATSDSNGRLMVQQSAPSQQDTFVNPFGDGNGIENTGHNIQSAPLGPPTQPVIHSMMTSPAINPMASGAEDVNSLTGMSSSQHSHPPPPYAPMVNNTSTISGNTLSSGDDGISANSQQPISNAAFNDLMGSILGDMGSGGDGTEDEDVNLTVDSDRQTKQGQEDVLRSLDSDHSLSTLVNSESFDLVMSGNGTKPSFTQHIPKNSLDKTITRIDDAVLSTTLDASQDAP